MSEKLSKFLNNIWADFERRIEAIVIQHEAKGYHEKAEEVRKQLAENRGYYQQICQRIEAPMRKPRVNREFVEKHRKLLILLIAKIEEKKLLDWTKEGTSLKILEANFDNFIKETIEAIPVEVEK
ncbi:hypothetical protein ES707_00354 [subsurface metagenome]